MAGFALVSQAMLDWLRTFHFDLASNPGQENMIIAEDEEIYKLIAARDADGAATAMANHLARANQRYQLASLD